MSLSNRRAFIEAALFAALAMVLSLIPDFAGWLTPSLGAIPILVLCLRRGTKYGLLASFSWGLLHFLLGKASILNIWQFLIEYLLAFTCMGVAGYFAFRFQKALQAHQQQPALLLAYLASFLAVLLRWTCHFVAGILFWGSYAPKGISAAWYSFTVNAPAALMTFALLAVSLTVLVLYYPRVFLD